MAERPFHPDLRLARVLPRGILPGPRALRLLRATERLPRRAAVAHVEVVPVAPGVSVRLLRPAAAAGAAPALLWIHGGGLVSGLARADDAFCAEVRDRLGAVVASVEYRRAPEHPFPVPLEDCHAALRWLAAQPGVDAARIAIGGGSAGGGLAAALALLARERGEIRPALQLLVYPMLDDRTALRPDPDQRVRRVWDQRSNRLGWRAYLGTAAGTDDVPALAAAARADDLSGLPPAWIGVGTVDLFQDEDVHYAQRLRQAGVPCVLEVVPGAYHGFDVLERTAPVTRAFVDAQVAALAGALTAGAPAG